MWLSIPIQENMEASFSFIKTVAREAILCYDTEESKRFPGLMPVKRCGVSDEHLRSF